MAKYDNQLLVILLQACALTTPRKGHLQIASTIYGIIIVTCLLFCQVCIFLVKFDYTYKQYTYTMIVLDVLQNSILVMLNCAAILKANYNNDNDVHTTLERIRTTLKVQTIHSYKYVEVVTAQLVVFVILIFLLLTPFHQELGIYKYANDVFFSFNIWLELLVVLQIFYTNRMIMDNFQQLNTNLLKYVLDGSILVPGEKKVEPLKHQQICHFIKVHNMLADAMSATSGNFGVQMSCLCCLLIVVLIQGINVALKTTLGYCPYYSDHLHLITSIIGIIVVVHIKMMCMIVFSCSHVNAEAKKTSVISSKLLVELQSLPEEVPLKRLLLLFITYCKCSDNFYSALGFIDINHETILILLECFSLYIVLVLQFP